MASLKQSLKTKYAKNNKAKFRVQYTYRKVSITTKEGTKTSISYSKKIISKNSKLTYKI